MASQPDSVAAPAIVGFFWDIENCPVPKGKAASKVVEAIRALHSEKAELEFLVICDVRRTEPEDMLDDLNAAQVNLQHVSRSTRKNAADEKLRQAMRKFVDVHYTNSDLTLVLVSGDLDFASDLSDFKRRKAVNVVLVHNKLAKESLLSAASQVFSFETLTASVPFKAVPVQPSFTELEIKNIPFPDEMPAEESEKRLLELVRPLNGNIKYFNPLASTAVLKFESSATANRAFKI